MTYLVIMVVVAAAGILRLWVQQRRQRTRLNSVAQFRTGLDKISGPSPIGRAPADRRPGTPGGRTRLDARPQQLDPIRREAAKKRLEARRAARTGSRD